MGFLYIFYKKLKSLYLMSFSGFYHLLLLGTFDINFINLISGPYLVNLLQIKGLLDFQLTF